MKCSIGQLRQIIKEILQKEALGTKTIMPPAIDSNFYEEELTSLKNIDAGLKTAMSTLADRLKKVNDEFLRRYAAAGASQEELKKKRKKSDELLTQLRSMDGNVGRDKSSLSDNDETLPPRNHR